ncbi:MAG: hypothetical protein JNK76_26460 [Planctomycetales bacterium]|nr:hypothetical protein [Planctomycetales bacterium]MBN8625277.1 hypothetical protein [Planctomycetota bacterium]
MTHGRFLQSGQDRPPADRNSFAPATTAGGIFGANSVDAQRRRCCCRRHLACLS